MVQLVDVFSSQGLDALRDHPARASLLGMIPFLSKICATNYALPFHKLLRQLAQIIYDDTINEKSSTKKRKNSNVTSVGPHTCFKCDFPYK